MGFNSAFKGLISELCWIRHNWLHSGRTAHRGSRGIALLFHDLGTRRAWGVSVTPRPLFTPGKDTVSIVQEAGWALGPVWTGAENLASIGIRSPDSPARSQSLYRLRYPAHWLYIPSWIMIECHKIDSFCSAWRLFLFGEVKWGEVQWSEVKVLLKMVCYTCRWTSLETRYSSFFPLCCFS